MATNNPDIRPALKKAIINYQLKTGKSMAQGDLAPDINASHVNNVASGRSVNKKLRRKIEKFIEKYEDE